MKTNEDGTMEPPEHSIIKNMCLVNAIIFATAQFWCVYQAVKKGRKKEGPRGQKISSQKIKLQVNGMFLKSRPRFGARVKINGNSPHNGFQTWNKLLQGLLQKNPTPALNSAYQEINEYLKKSRPKEFLSIHDFQNASFQMATPILCAMLRINIVVKSSYYCDRLEACYLLNKAFPIIFLHQEIVGSKGHVRIIPPILESFRKYKNAHGWACIGCNLPFRGKSYNHKCKLPSIHVQQILGISTQLKICLSCRRIKMNHFPSLLSYEHFCAGESAAEECGKCGVIVSDKNCMQFHASKVCRHMLKNDGGKICFKCHSLHNFDCCCKMKGDAIDKRKPPVVCLIATGEYGRPCLECEKLNAFCNFHLIHQPLEIVSTSHILIRRPGETPDDYQEEIFEPSGHHILQHWKSKPKPEKAQKRNGRVLNTFSVTNYTKKITPIKAVEQLLIQLFQDTCYNNNVIVCASESLFFDIYKTLENYHLLDIDDRPSTPYSTKIVKVGNKILKIRLSNGVEVLNIKAIDVSYDDKKDANQHFFPMAFNHPDTEDKEMGFKLDYYLSHGDSLEITLAKKKFIRASQMRNWNFSTEMRCHLKSMIKILNASIMALENLNKSLLSHLNSLRLIREQPSISMFRFTTFGQYSEFLMWTFGLNEQDLFTVMNSETGTYVAKASRLEYKVSEVERLKRIEENNGSTHNLELEGSFLSGKTSSWGHFRPDIIDRRNKRLLFINGHFWHKCLVMECLAQHKKPDKDWDKLLQEDQRKYREAIEKFPELKDYSVSIISECEVQKLGKIEDPSFLNAKRLIPRDSFFSGLCDLFLPSFDLKDHEQWSMESYDMNLGTFIRSLKLTILGPSRILLGSL